MFFNFKLEPWQKDAIKNFLELAESHAAKGKQGSIICQVGKTAKGDVIIKGAFIRNDCSTLIKSILDEYFDKINVSELPKTPGKTSTELTAILKQMDKP